MPFMKFQWSMAAAPGNLNALYSKGTSWTITNKAMGGIIWMNELVVFSIRCNTSEFLHVMTANDKVPIASENTEMKRVIELGNHHMKATNKRLT